MKTASVPAILLLAAGLAGPICQGANAPRSAPLSPLNALLRRAEKEPAASALEILASARRKAEAARDRAGLLAVAASAARLARARHEAADYTTANRLHRLGLEIRERVVPNTAAHAESLNGVARAISAEDPPGARSLLQRALVIAQAAAPGSLTVASSLNGLGTVAWRQGDLAVANDYFRRSLAIREKLAPNSLDMAASLNGLGNVSWNQGDLAAANQYFHRALTIYAKLAPNSLRVAGILNNFGVVASARGDLSAAREHFQRALTIEQKLSPNSLVAAASLNNLGNIAGDQGDLSAAKEYYQRALAIEVGFAPNSLGVVGILNNLGTVASALGDLSTAKEYYQRCLAIEEKLAPNSLGVAESLNNLGNHSAAAGDLAEASELYQRSLAIQETLAPNSLGVAGILNNLGNLARNQGELAEATKFYQRALAIRKQLAPNSVDVAGSLNNLGTILDEQGDAGSAIALQRMALRIIEQRAPGALLVPLCLRNMARMLLESQEPAWAQEASGLLERAGEIEERVSAVPGELAPSGGAQTKGQRAQPRVRFVEPAENSTVTGSEVQLRLVFLAPIPPARYRIWINGRPVGPRAGFALPQVNAKGQVLDKGRVLDKGEVLDNGRVLDRGQVLSKENDRERVAKELPQAVAALVRKPEYAHFIQIRHTVPVEDTDGEFVRIAVQAETTGGSVSDREILRLRRPQAEVNRGSLRVLAVGIGAYERLPKLGYAAADALALGDAFRGQAGDGKPYRGADITMVTEADATLGRLREALGQFTHNVRPGDTLILALSGHGIRVGPPPVNLSAMSLDAMMAHEPVQPKFYFAPVRFDPENPEGTGLPWSEVLAKLEVARKTAKAVWVLADCCRAAPGLRRESIATARDLKRGIDEGGNLILCTASEGDNPSYESEDLKHGIFTQAWLEALSGKGPEIVYEDRPRGKVLTLSGLQFAVDYAVRQHARKAGVRQQVEFPRLEGSFSPGQPVFVPVAR